MGVVSEGNNSGLLTANALSDGENHRTREIRLAKSPEMMRRMPRFFIVILNGSEQQFSNEEFVKVILIKLTGPVTKLYLILRKRTRRNFSPPLEKGDRYSIPTTLGHIHRDKILAIYDGNLHSLLGRDDLAKRLSHPQGKHDNGDKQREWHE
jgi:hypothetical protein